MLHYLSAGLDSDCWRAPSGGMRSVWLLAQAHTPGLALSCCCHCCFSCRPPRSYHPAAPIHPFLGAVVLADCHASLGGIIRAHYKLVQVRPGPESLEQLCSRFLAHLWRPAHTLWAGTACCLPGLSLPGSPHLWRPHLDSPRPPGNVTSLGLCGVKTAHLSTRHGTHL